MTPKVQMTGQKVYVSKITRYDPAAGRDVYQLTVNGTAINGGPDGTEMGADMHMCKIASQYKAKGVQAILIRR